MRTLLIPTCNRPETFRECLGAVLANYHSSALSLVLVLDDSTDTDVVRHNANVIENANISGGTKIIHIDNSKKNRLVHELMELSDASVPESVLRGALFQPARYAAITGGGANRNTGLLLTAGQRYISIDDDARFSFSVLGQTDAASFTVETSLNGCYSSGMIDRASRVEKSAVPFAGNAIALMHAALDITGEKNARTRLAMTGIVGRRWFDTPWQILQNADVFRDLVYCRRGRYRAARQSGYAAMQPTHSFVINFPLLVTCCYAADTSEIVPPFPPIAEAEDTMFSLLVNACYPDNLTAHLPIMVHHDLGEARPFSSEDYSRSGVTFGDLSTFVIRYLTRSEPLDHGAHSMRQLGEKMTEVGELNHGEWLEFTRSLWLEQSGKEISALEGLIEKHNGKPRFWARDVETRIEQIKRETSGMRHVVPRELLHTHTPEEAGELHRSFFRSYGELIYYWPEIWRLALKRNELLT